MTTDLIMRVDVRTITIKTTTTMRGGDKRFKEVVEHAFFFSAACS